MNVEVVRLKAIHAGSHFRNPITAIKFEDRHARRFIFIRLKIFPLRLCVIARDLLNLSVHEEQQGIERVATRGQERAATEVLFDVPRVLTVPRPNPVIVIQLAIVQVAEQARVNEGAASIA